MAQDSEIGIVFPDDPHACGWNRNLPFVEPFFPALGIEGPYREIAFPIGTMFWARPAALKRMFALRLGWTDYPAEPLPYDGSLLHGLERVFGLVVMGHGSRVALTHVAGRTR
jgi:lipopolysaccharide biosynthesis protein